MRRDTWECPIVIGHRRPDLDSVAAALSYAALLQRMGREAVAARAGGIDEQTQWALEQAGLSAPDLLHDAAPSFGQLASSEPVFTTSVTLQDVMLALARGARALPVLDAEQRPVALLDPRAAVRALGSVLPTEEGEATWQRGLSTPYPWGADALCFAPSRTFAENERVSSRRAILVKEEADDFVVVDQNGQYVGVVRRADALAPPRRRLILVDHNELSQAVPGAEEAEIVEVVDHHRLSPASTLTPIPFQIDVVGSTATLLEARWRDSGQDLPPSLAKLMCAAILSDTLAFRSPTSTFRDEQAARRLARRGQIGDLESFGLEVITSGLSLTGRDPRVLVEEDAKEYASSVGLLVISQLEVRSLHDVTAQEEALEAALEQHRASRGAALGLLLLTDPVRARSHLLGVGDRSLLARLPFKPLHGQLMDAGDVVSRKKQLLPSVLATLEQG